MPILLPVNLNGQSHVLSFDGTNDYVDLGTSVGNNLRTIEMWFKPDVNYNSSASDDIALIARNDASQSGEYSLYIGAGSRPNRAGRLVFQRQDIGSTHYIISNDNQWNANQWYHVAGVIDPVSGMKLYIDGVLQSDTDASTNATGNRTEISTIARWGDLSIRYFDGRIEEVRLWDRALSNAEIQAKRCITLDPAIETGLKAYWNMNEGFGSVINDSTTNNNNGNILGATWQWDSISCGTINPPIVSGNVLHFDGTNDYVDLGTSVGSNLRTIEMWFKPDANYNSSLSGDIALIARNDASQSGEYSLYIGAGNRPNRAGKLVFQRQDNGSTHYIVSNDNQWNANQWYHVAGVIDPVSGMKLYIDGVLQSDTDASTNATGNRTEISTIARWGDLSIRYFDGRIEEVRLWDRALSNAEVQAKRCITLDPAIETGLKAYWNMNEGFGSTINDSTTNNNNGTILGATWQWDSISCGAINPPIVSGNVLHFDGVDDYVDLGPNVVNGARTIEFWFNPDVNIDPSLQNRMQLIGIEIPNPNVGEWHASIEQAGTVNPPGRLKFVVVTSVGQVAQVYSDSSSWNANQWYHVAVVIDSTQGMMLFIDGIKQSVTNPYNSALVVNSNVNIEAGRHVGFNRYFDGKMDDIRISSDAVYLSNFARPCTDIKYMASTIGLWNFNGSGTTATDSSSNNFDGAIYGAARQVDTIDCSPIIPPSPNGNVLDFDGVNDYVDLGTSVGNNLRTIEMWFKPDVNYNSSASDDIALIARNDASQSGEYSLYIGAGSRPNRAGRLVFQRQDNGSTHYIVSNDNQWNANQWYHIAGVIDPLSGMKLYIDGVLQNDTDASTNATGNRTEMSTIARWGDLSIRYFDGRIEEVKLWDRALSNAEIQAKRCITLDPAIETGLKAYWNMNEGFGSVINDSTINNNNGTILGATWQWDSIGCNNISVNYIASEMYEISFYPNPFFSNVRIDSDTNLANLTLLIYNFSGVLVYRIENITSNSEIELNNLPKGSYSIILKSERMEIISSKKLIKL